MTRQEAYNAMKNGEKITHHYFSKDEYYEMKNGNGIFAEDGVNHTAVFWSGDNNDWRADGWEIFKPNNMKTETKNIDKQISELNEKISILEKQKEKLKYEEGRLHHNDDVDKFLRGFYGERLMKEHHISDYGLWEILGEDPNCDYSGSHIQPHIAYVEGTLEQAILYAVKQPKWNTWGTGGNIKPIPDQLIIKL